MNINKIVESKWLDLDETDNAEVDAFILAISQTEEYGNEVINEIDFDMSELLYGIATCDDDYRDTYLEQFKTTIRENALTLHQNVMIDLAAQAQDAKDAHGDYLHDLQVQARIDNE